MSQKLEHPAELTDVNRVLRCRRTQRYFTGDGWTDNPSHAQPFPTEAEALRACVSHDLHDMDLVLRAPAHGAELSATPIR